MKKLFDIKSLKSRNFWKSEEGATAIEYGLIASLVAIAIIAGATGVGETLSNVFNTISSGVEGAGTSA